MLAEVGCILAGIPLGYALRNHAPIVRVANGMASGIIYALLFLLGVSLGSNDQLVVRLGELGVQGVAIGLACALGSVAVTARITTKFFQHATLQGASRDGASRDITPPAQPSSPVQHTAPSMRPPAFQKGHSPVRNTARQDGNQ